MISGGPSIANRAIFLSSRPLSIFLLSPEMKTIKKRYKKPVQEKVDFLEKWLFDLHLAFSELETTWQARLYFCELSDAKSYLDQKQWTCHGECSKKQLFPFTKLEMAGVSKYHRLSFLSSCRKKEHSEVIFESASTSSSLFRLLLRQNLANHANVLKGLTDISNVKQKLS